jgi:Ca2+-binding RTX toxin-like protein
MRRDSARSTSPADRINDYLEFTGYDWLSRVGLPRERPGRRVFIEDIGPGPLDAFTNHSVLRITDSLLVTEVLRLIDPAFENLERASLLLDAASPAAERSYERVVDHLVRLFAPALAGSTVVGDDEIAARESLHQRLIDLSVAIRQRSGFSDTADTLGLRIANIADISASDLAAQFRADIGVRYALVNGLSFAISGDDTLYSDSAAELDNGQFSDDYVRDRISFVQSIGFFHNNDLPPAGGAYSFGDPRFVRSVLHDAATGLSVEAGLSVAWAASAQGTPPPHQLIRFGTNQNDVAAVLAGGHDDDRIYGLAGNDILSGGAGNDLLDGGTGDDTYRIRVGEGNDTIIDADGTGCIVLILADGTERILTGAGNRLDAGSWHDDDLDVWYFVDGTDLRIEVGGSTITVRNYQGALPPGAPSSADAESSASDKSGGSFLGISLTPNFVDDRRAPPSPIDGHVRDLPNQIQIFPVVYGPNSVGRNDRYIFEVFETSATLSRGLGGDDWITASNVSDVLNGDDGRDRLEGRGGNDWIIGEAIYGDHTGLYLPQEAVANPSTASDTLIGGTGNDVLVGEWGDDYLYAEDEITLQQMAERNRNQVGTGAVGDALDGGDGDDRLFGDAGNDILLGGAGADTIYGGGGDDLILSDEQFAYDWTLPTGPGLAADVYRFFPTTPQLSFSVTTVNGVTTYSYTLGSNVQLWSAVTVEQRADTIFAGNGNDFVRAGGGNDYVDGGAGNDYLTGGAGVDTIYGGEGDDAISGEVGSNTLSEQATGGGDAIYGGAGNDLIYGAWGNDTIDGGEGDDIIHGDGPTSALIAAQFSGSDVRRGGAGHDTLLRWTGDPRQHGEAEQTRRSVARRAQPAATSPAKKPLNRRVPAAARKAVSALALNGRRTARSPLCRATKPLAALVAALALSACGAMPFSATPTHADDWTLEYSRTRLGGDLLIDHRDLDNGVCGALEKALEQGWLSISDESRCRSRLLANDAGQLAALGFSTPPWNWEPAPKQFSDFYSEFSVGDVRQFRFTLESADGSPSVAGVAIWADSCKSSIGPHPVPFIGVYLADAPAARMDSDYPARFKGRQFLLGAHRWEDGQQLLSVRTMNLKEISDRGPTLTGEQLCDLRTAGEGRQ